MKYPKLPGKIRDESDRRKKLKLAINGRDVSETELLITVYARSQEIKSMYGQDPEIGTWLLTTAARKLSKQYLLLLQNRDWKALQEISEMLKRCDSDDGSIVDVHRTGILISADIMTRLGMPPNEFTTEEWAGITGVKDVDVLRRMLKECGVHWKKDQGGRPKKTPTEKSETPNIQS